MLQVDPPRHTKLRRLAGKAFTIRAVEAMRPRVRELVDAMLSDVGPGDTFDLIERVAYPLPATVISEMLGVPLEDHARVAGTIAYELACGINSSPTRARRVVTR